MAQFKITHVYPHATERSMLTNKWRNSRDCIMEVSPSCL